jgi:hypothetical protein
MENKNIMKTRGIVSLIVGAILLVLYNVCVFVSNEAITDLYNGPAFWISYAMMMIAFFAVIAVFLITLFVKAEPKDAVLRMPIFYHAIIYFCLELVVSSAFIRIDVFVSTRYWVVALLVQLIMLSLFIVIIITSFFVKNHVQTLDNKVKDKTNFIKLLKVDVDMIAEMSADPEVRKAYLDLSEQVRYSDPMSHESLFELEKQILECLSFAKRAVELEKNDAALQNCYIASRLLFERNEKTKALK